MPDRSSLEYEVNVAAGGRGSVDELDRIGTRSAFACPDCHGVMWEIAEGEVLRYRCHGGHAYTAEVMSIAFDEALTRAVGTALRALEERVALLRRLERQDKQAGLTQLACSWAAQAMTFEAEADVVRGSMRSLAKIAAR
jgi:two-component system, chemotaxis family, protein-glutamate methylesterase/glutaminase